MKTILPREREEREARNRLPSHSAHHKEAWKDAGCEGVGGLGGCDLNIGESGNGSERVLTDRVLVRAMRKTGQDGLKKITSFAKDRMSERGDERKCCERK